MKIIALCFGFFLFGCAAFDDSGCGQTSWVINQNRKKLEEILKQAFDAENDRAAMIDIGKLRGEEWTHEFRIHDVRRGEFASKMIVFIDQLYRHSKSEEQFACIVDQAAKKSGVSSALNVALTNFPNRRMKFRGTMDENLNEEFEYSLYIHEFRRRYL